MPEDIPKENFPDRPAISGNQPDLEGRRIRSDVERMMLFGVVSASDVAIRHNLSEPEARELMLSIRGDWRRRLENRDDARMARVEQLNAIIVKASNAFERSRRDIEKIKVDVVTCELCSGRKFVGKPDDPSPCPSCGATGKIKRESVVIEQTPGDPSFLSVAISAIKEAGKFEGTYDERGRVPGGVGVSASRMLASLSVKLDPNGTPESIELRKEIEEFYDELPEETIIGGLIAIDTIDRARAKKASANKRAIQVTGDSQEQGE